MTISNSLANIGCSSQSATDMHKLNEAGLSQDTEIELAKKTRYKQVGGGDEIMMMKNNRKVEKR